VRNNLHTKNGVMKTIANKLKSSGVLQAIWGVAVVIALGWAIGSEPHTKTTAQQTNAIASKAIVTVR
jgi:hypothetical protein